MDRKGANFFIGGTGRFWPVAAFRLRPLPAKSGQLRRVSSPSLKLEGVYRNRGDSYVEISPRRITVAGVDGRMPSHLGK